MDKGKILETNKEISSILKNISTAYPVIAPSSAKYPYVVFTRNTTTINYHKVGISSVESYFTVTVVSDKYQAAFELTEKIIEAVLAYDYKIIEVSEEFSDAYLITLTITKTI